jgi:hypothetical protein
MPVIVTPPSTINVRVGNPVIPVVTSTSTFTGATNVQNEIDAISATANSALQTANIAYALASSVYTVANNALTTANSAYAAAANSLPLTGGEITGNLIVDQTFTALLDGGRF